MRIALRNRNRQRLFSVTVDAKSPPAVVKPPDGHVPDVYLNWEQAFDDQGYLRRCPACGCRELFVRKDFPQAAGLLVVVAAAAAALVLFALNQVFWAFAVLGGVALLDAVIYGFTGRCLVCYRCRSEFRDVPIQRGHRGWDLAIGEKYRPDSEQPPPEPAGPEAKATPPASDPTVGSSES